MEVGGDRGFVLAPGCDLPYATPPANLEAIAKIALDPYELEVAKTVVTDSSDEERLEYA